MPDKTDWPNKANCAECDAVNQALHNFAKWEDIQIHTIDIDKNGNMSDYYRCNECLGIFNDMYVTSE
ncbi:MAG: glutaredoxin family protein [Bacteroidia bacterium]|nr:glutaredoxin family protein [Bacteroidia bacterium]